MEPFDPDTTEVNHRRTLLAITAFVLWVVHILKQAQLLCSFRIHCFILFSYGQHTDRLLYKYFHYDNRNVVITKSRCIRNDPVVLQSYFSRRSSLHLICQSKSYAGRYNGIPAESLSVPYGSTKPSRSLDEQILKLKNVLHFYGGKILESKRQHGVVSHTAWLDHKHKLAKVHSTFSFNCMEYVLNTSLPGENIFDFQEVTPEKRVVEYTIAYHTIQHFQHMSSSSSSSCVSNSAVQTNFKPPHRSASPKKQQKGSTTKANSKHNHKSFTSPQPSKTKSTTSKAKDIKNSSTTKSSTKPKIKKKPSKADTVNHASKINTRNASLSKCSCQKEKIIGSVGPTPSMCYITTAQSSSSFPKPLIKMPKNKSKATNQCASSHGTTKVHKKASSKKLKKSGPSSKQPSDYTRVINPSLMMLLPDDIEHHSPSNGGKPEVYRPAFCKSLQTIPEDKSVNLTSCQVPGNDYLYGFQPHFWSLPNDCFRYTWPMLSQPFCQQQSWPYVAPYQARPVPPVNAKCQNLAALDTTSSQIFFLANHLGTTHHNVPGPSREKGKAEKPTKKKCNKKKHSKAKKK